ncbi:MAG: S8 family peptidase [Caulobacteraceae bacterium]
MMRRLSRWMAIGVALCLGMSLAAPSGARAGEAAAREAETAAARQILVLLRLAPEHYRPGADYGGGYGEGPARAAHRRIAAALARQHGLTLASDWPLPLAGVDCFVMNVPAGGSPDALAAALSHDKAVAWAEPMRLYHGEGAPAPNDPLFPFQPAAREWGLADLYAIATGRHVRVAVIDSLVERAHPDLVGQVELAEDFVGDPPTAAEWHGTGVAGVIAARANNGIGMAGVAPNARLLALRACWQAPGTRGAASASLCDSLSLAKALHFAIAHKAQVINLSLSGPADPLLGKLIDVALARGVTVVGAVDGDLPGGGFPASHPGVVAVADESLGVQAAGVFVAPGRDVPTTQPGGRWFLVNGSSFAAAQVSGLFALARERNGRAQGASALVRAPAGSAIDARATLLRGTRPIRRAGVVTARIVPHRSSPERSVAKVGTGFATGKRSGV